MTPLEGGPYTLPAPAGRSLGERSWRETCEVHGRSLSGRFLSAFRFSRDSALRVQGSTFRRHSQIRGHRRDAACRMLLQGTRTLLSELASLLSTTSCHIQPSKQIESSAFIDTVAKSNSIAHHDSVRHKVSLGGLKRLSKHRAEHGRGEPSQVASRLWNYNLANGRMKITLNFLTPPVA